jgi:peroxiredoxin
MLNQGSGSAKPTNDGSIHVGDKAPLFDLFDLDGEPFSLTDCFGDKPTILVFWSYSCFPCQSEMPILQEFYEETGKDNLTMVAVSLDTTDFAKFIDPFVAKHKLTFPILYDKETELFYDTAERYGVVGTPTTFLIDSDGVIRFIHLGRLNKQVLAGIVESAKSKSYCADIIKPAVSITTTPKTEKAKAKPTN